MRIENSGTTNDILPGLTEKQKEFWYLWNDRQNWRPPTFRWIMKRMNLKNVKSVHNYKEAIEKKGYYFPKTNKDQQIE